MSGLLSAANAIMSGAERRLEIIAQNVANLSTPGYQRVRSFAVLLADRNGQMESPQVSSALDAAPGPLVATGNPLDLTLASPGMLLVRDGDTYYAVRSGSFRRDAEGRLIDGRGRVLQQAGGGDLELDSATPEILADGTILVDGQAASRVGVFAMDDDVAEASAAGVDPAGLADVEAPQLRQGYVQQSNVTLDAEMVEMMQISRSAESGARIVQVYDELMGRVISSIGQTGR